ncbi:MAG: hypothetical protein HUU50_03430 [Candidatus Brocadiae bacterium]|nr:hypothetical protein [Candidatus Brocadiia bacterium]
MHHQAMREKYTAFLQFGKNVMIFFIVLCLCCCSGTHIYKIEKPQSININLVKKLPGTVSFKVAAETIYHHNLGYKKYQLYVKDAMEKQLSESLGQCFEGGVQAENAETNLIITALDTSTFPIASIINDVRLFFRVEVFDQKMSRQKTTTVYGFGCDADGTVALGKAVSNSFYQLLPVLEELFIRQ